MIISWRTPAKKASIRAGAESIKYGFSSRGNVSTPLTAGVVSFVSSGISGIVITATDAVGGLGPYTYQWQRNTDGGVYGDISNGGGVLGATTLTITDNSAISGLLYGYKLVYTDALTATATSNAITAEVYTGGDIGFSAPVVLLASSGDIDVTPKLEESVYRDFITSSNTGAASDADSLPTVEVFEDGTDTSITSPTVSKRTSKTGDYRAKIDCTAANGFEAGKSYNAVATATVGGVVAKAVIWSGQVRTRSVDDILPTASYITPLTAAQIATGIFQDTTAGDFTVAGSIGKSLFTGGAVPGASGGLFISGTNAATVITGSLTTTFTGNLTGTVASVVGAVGSVAGSVGSVVGAVGSVTAGVVVTTNNDKTGYTLTQSFPTNFASLGIGGTGHITNVDTLTTYTGNTLQTGDAFARLGAPAGASISADVATKPSLAQILAGGDIDGYSIEQFGKLCLAALAGKISGATTTTITIKAADDSKTRITATVDADGNRTALTLDAVG